MLKKVISVSLIMLFLFVSFAGVFANGHKHGNGEFIEEEVITQEYKAAVEGKDAIPAKIGYKIKYNVEAINPNNKWTYDVKFGDKEIAENTESDPFENNIPDIYVEATRTNPDITIHLTKNDLQEGANVVTLNGSTNQAGNVFNGQASFTVNVEVTKVTITEAEEGTKAEDEIIGKKEIYITGYKITSGKYTGYSVMFAEKVLKCTIKFKIVDGKEQVIDTKDTKEWHKLKCLEFGIYVKKTCKWGNGKHLFEYNKWRYKGGYVKVENEESVIVEESVTGNQESTTVEKESTTSNEESGKQDTLISIENNDYDSNEGSSSNGSNSSGYSSNSSANDDTTAVNHTVTSNGLPKTGESASANIIFYCIGGLLLMVAGIILFRKKVINKFTE